MGYTHYYEVKNREAFRAIWPALVDDTRKIIEATKDTIPICDSLGGKRTKPLVDEKRGIALNGRGDWSHESFHLHPKQGWECCKTAQKPYDVVVCAILLRGWQRAGKAFSVRSDGDWEDWEESVELVKRLWPGDEVTCPWVNEIDDQGQEHNGGGDDGEEWDYNDEGFEEEESAGEAHEHRDDEEVQTSQQA